MYCLIFSLVKTLVNFPYLIGYEQAQFYSQQDIVHIMLLTEHCLTLFAFLWGDPSSDQWSNLSRSWCIKGTGECVPLGWSELRSVIQDLSGSWCIKGTGECTLVVDSPVPLMHHDPDRSWITDPNSDHPKGTHSPVPLIYHDPDKSWITDPNSDHPKGTHPLSCAIAR